MARPLSCTCPTRAAPLARPQEPIPAVFLTTSLVLGGEAGQYAPVTLRAECILFGPVIQGPNAHLLRNVTLNMGRQPNILQLAVRGRLLISHLVSGAGSGSTCSGPGVLGLSLTWRQVWRCQARRSAWRQGPVQICRRGVRPLSRLASSTSPQVR